MSTVKISRVRMDKERRIEQDIYAIKIAVAELRVLVF
jgi:hypothetical protein